MKSLSIKDIECIAHNLAKKIMEWNEPIPDFSTRYLGKLESCLKTPFQSFAKKELYSTLEDKAAILFYLMIKNHPFQNGNKRIAVTSLLTFLSLNQKWLNIPPDELYGLALWVAESRPPAKVGTVQAVKDYLKKYIVEWNKIPFHDGEILFSSSLHKMYKSIVAIEQILKIKKTNFPKLRDGDILMAEHLNSIMQAVDRLYGKMKIAKKTWCHMPVKDGDHLKSETLNEIWKTIGQSVKILQQKLIEDQK